MNRRPRWPRGIGRRWNGRTRPRLARPCLHRIRPGLEPSTRLDGDLLADHLAGQLYSRHFECLLGIDASRHIQDAGNETGPARLMARAETGAVVTVEVLIEQDVVL